MADGDHAPPRGRPRRPARIRTRARNASRARQPGVDDRLGPTRRVQILRRPAEFLESRDGRLDGVQHLAAGLLPIAQGVRPGVDHDVPDRKGVACLRRSDRLEFDALPARQAVRRSAVPATFIRAEVSFLDEVPQDWTAPELTELRDLFVLAYRRPTAAEQLADEVGIVAGTFPLLDTMRATWTELIREIGNQGKLRAMVEHAAKDPTAAAYQPRFAEMLSDHPAIAAARATNGSATWWKGDDTSPAVTARLYPERLMERRN